MSQLNLDCLRKNKHRLPDELLGCLLRMEESTLLQLASALHGARISAATQREKRFALKLAAHGRDYERTKGVWDFVSEQEKRCIDLKSGGFDHNTPIALWAEKYLRALPAGYCGTFVVQPGAYDLSVHWPISKLADLGLPVVTEQEFFNG